MSWVVHHRVGDAGEFHALEPAAVRSITFHMVEQPTVVLGSAQPDSDIDWNLAMQGTRVVFHGFFFKNPQNVERC